jgi:hypothetical protein
MANKMISREVIGQVALPHSGSGRDTGLSEAADALGAHEQHGRGEIFLERCGAAGLPVGAPVQAVSGEIDADRGLIRLEVDIDPHLRPAHVDGRPTPRLVAQLIDGALGMAYVVISNSLLLAMGLPPAAASASVHAAEIVTTGVSGLSHHLFGNVDRALLKRLAIPGVVGAAIGAYTLVSAPGDAIKPFIALYLLSMGVLIIWKTFRGVGPRRQVRHVSILGLTGGFCDAIGGGGTQRLARCLYARPTRRYALRRTHRSTCSRCAARAGTCCKHTMSAPDRSDAAPPARPACRRPSRRGRVRPAAARPSAGTSRRTSPPADAR